MMASHLHCNVCAYDYSGYGLSTGRPLESNLYADAQAVWECPTNRFVSEYHNLSSIDLNRFGISANNIIIYGQSIGTVPSVDLATRVRPAGLILHSPLASGIRVMFPNVRTNWCCDPFPSLKKMPRVKAQTLIIHGLQVGLFALTSINLNRVTGRDH